MHKIFNKLTQFGYNFIDPHSAKNFPAYFSKFIEDDDYSGLTKFLAKAQKELGSELLATRINSVFQLGDPCLYLANLKSNTIFALLLKYGADPNIPSKATNSPLKYITQVHFQYDNNKSNESKIKILLLYGADIKRFSILGSKIDEYNATIRNKTDRGIIIKRLQNNINECLDKFELVTINQDTAWSLVVNYSKLAAIWLDELRNESNQEFKNHYYEQCVEACTSLAKIILEHDLKIVNVGEIKQTFEQLIPYCIQYNQKDLADEFNQAKEKCTISLDNAVSYTQK